MLRGRGGRVRLGVRSEAELAKVLPACEEKSCLFGCPSGAGDGHEAVPSLAIAPGHQVAVHAALQISDGDVPAVRRVLVGFDARLRPHSDEFCAKPRRVDHETAPVPDGLTL